MCDVKEIKYKIMEVVGESADELGYGVYIVGGFVRDRIMKMECDDMDFVCVSGDKIDSDYVRPGIAVANLVAQKLGVDEVREFKNFGTAQINYMGIEAEFVGARKESYERGSRKPIVENGTLDDDINRRDLTINAIAYCLNKGKHGIVDKFNGIGDIEAGVIRTPLDPDITFSDDPLRMLRAIRFAVRFNFVIDQVTFDGIKRNAKRLEIISAERITTELNKILMSNDPSRGIMLLKDSGLLDVFLPEVSMLDDVKTINSISHKNNFQHTLGVLDYIGKNNGSLNARYAALLHDIGKIKTRVFEDNAWSFKYHEIEGAKMVETIFNRLRLPIDDMKHVKKLVEYHMRPQTIVEDVTDSAIRRLMFDAGDDLDDLMLLCMADVTSKHEDKVKHIREGFENLKIKFKEIEEKDHVRNFQPPVDGNEIMEKLNLQPSRIVGVIKEDVKDAILDGRLENDHDKALCYIMSKYGNELN